MKDENSLFNRLRFLIALRKDNDVFNSQEMDFLFRENKGLFAVLRGSRDQGLLCIHNLTNTPQKVDVSGYQAQLLAASANQPLNNDPVVRLETLRLCVAANQRLSARFPKFGKNTRNVLGRFQIEVKPNIFVGGVRPAVRIADPQ